MKIVTIDWERVSDKAFELWESELEEMDTEEADDIQDIDSIPDRLYEKASEYFSEEASDNGCFARFE